MPSSMISRSSGLKQERYYCHACDKSFSRKRDLKRHTLYSRAHREGGDSNANGYPCKLCNRVLTRQDILRKHQGNKKCLDTFFKILSKVDVSALVTVSPSPPSYDEETINTSDADDDDNDSKNIINPTATAGFLMKTNNHTSSQQEEGQGMMVDRTSEDGIPPSRILQDYYKDRIDEIYTYASFELQRFFYFFPHYQNTN